MKNQHFGRNIFGDLPTQKWAQEALPILILSAQKGEPLIMRDLAEEIAPERKQFNWIMKSALAWIHTTLYELENSDEWPHGEIPCLTAIVLAGPQKPTNWADKETRVNPEIPLPWEDYREKHLVPLFKYPHWEKVREFVFGS